MTAARTVVFRCDASPQIGGGHVYRSMALANAFERAGWQVGFAVAETTPAVVPALLRQAWRVETGLMPGDAGATVLAAAWPNGIDLAVVDSYAIAAPQEARLRPWAARLLAIDDLADRDHDCDVLLDQTLGRSSSDYARLVPPNTKLLCGARYALLRPEFADVRAASLARRGPAVPADRVLVSLGATDVGGITRESVLAVRDASAAIRVDVVVGVTAPSLPCLKEIAARDPRLRIHIGTAEMARFMAAADLAVGAAGTSAWERCCVGLPTVMVVLADNQEGVAAALGAAGAAVVIGDAPDRQRRIATALRQLLADPDRRAAISARAARVTDGHGADRIVAAVETLSAP